MHKDNAIQLRISSVDKAKLAEIAKQITRTGTITQLLDEYIQKLIKENNINNPNDSEPF